MFSGYLLIYTPQIGHVLLYFGQCFTGFIWFRSDLLGIGQNYCKFVDNFDLSFWMAVLASGTLPQNDTHFTHSRQGGVHRMEQF